VGAEPNIEIQKSNNTDDQGILPCDQVEFTIVVKNTGGTAYDGVLWDVMYDPFGDIVYEEYWELGDLATGDELLITYGVDFATTSPWGIFTNVAEVSAVAGHPELNQGGYLVYSNFAESDVKVKNTETPKKESLEKEANEEPEDPYAVPEEPEIIITLEEVGSPEIAENFDNHEYGYSQIASFAGSGSLFPNVQFTHMAYAREDGETKEDKKGFLFMLFSVLPFMKEIIATRIVYLTLI
jgi:hypothetical protein